jgi:hypothetical protein
LCSYGNEEKNTNTQQTKGEIKMKWLEQFEPISNTTNVKAIYEVAGIVDGLGGSF